MDSSPHPPLNVLLANPRGFCAGVSRAIDIVERALEKFGAPIYVRHEIVHNRYVVNDLQAKGVIFIDDLDVVPDNAVLVFSAHGVSQVLRHKAQTRQFQVFDATCPLVKKVHIEIHRLHAAGFHIVMVGHKGHPEVEGTMGQVPNRVYLVESITDVAALPLHADQPVAYVTQTTLSLDDTADIVAALRQRFPNIQEPKKSDICYATQNRQIAVKELARQVDLVLVVGSPNSSNSNRLREVALKFGVPAHLIDSAQDIRCEWFTPHTRHVGLTAGASAPEHLIAEIVDHLRKLGASSVRTLPGESENVHFPLPKELLI